MNYVGIDYGTKKTGIAISSEDGTIAFPHAVWATDGTLVSRVTELMQKRHADTVVVGHSQDFKGNDNPVMKEARAFGVRLAEEAGCHTHFEPEFLTSVQARRYTEKKEMVDASAAALILQSFLDRQAS